MSKLIDKAGLKRIKKHCENTVCYNCKIKIMCNAFLGVMINKFYMPKCPCNWTDTSMDEILEFINKETK